MLTKSNRVKARELVLELMEGRQPDIAIQLPYLPPAQPNAGYQGSNLNVIRAKIRQIKAQCRKDVTARLLEAGWVDGTPPFQQAVVLVTFWLPTRGRRDHDNLVAAMKPIFDALHPDEDHPDGVLVDDNLGVIGIPFYDYDVRPGLTRTIIEIWDTSPERLL